VGKEQYISLIAKKLNNDLNIAELRELNNWLSSNSENPELLSDFQHIWNSVSTYKVAESFDSSAAFNKFSKKYDLTAEPASISPQINPQGLSPNGGFSAIKYLIFSITAAMLVLGGYFLSKTLSPTFVNDTMAALPINLTDKATATLKPNTSLKFNSNELIISGLDGGAYFNFSDVDQAKPISFDLSNAKIMASAAKLNLQNYDGEDLIADVEKGSVLLNLNNKEITVKEGQKVIISKENGSHSIIEGDSSAFDWSKGVLSFDNTPLHEVFNKIEKFYGVEIQVIDKSEVSGHYNASYSNPVSIDEVLDALRTSISMRITKKGRDIQISEIKPEVKPIK